MDGPLRYYTLDLAIVLKQFFLLLSVYLPFSSADIFKICDIESFVAGAISVPVSNVN